LGNFFRYAFVCAFPLLIGLIPDKKNSAVKTKHVSNGAAFYDCTNAFLTLALLSFSGIILTFLLKRGDKSSGYGLELPSNSKK